MIPNPKEKQSFLQTSGQDAGTQCLSRTHGVFSRLRRTHGVFSRLRRAHSAFRAYGGHTVPLAPTASPKEANCEEFAFRSIWEGPTEASENFHTGKNYSPTTCKK